MSTGPSESEAGILFAALMPHAPILVPEVGRERLQPAAASVAAMKLAATRLAARQPQAVVVISPHSPRNSGAFGLWGGSRLWGSFHQFGAPSTVVELPNDVRLRAEVIVQTRQMGLQTWDIPNEPLDHGALVEHGRHADLMARGGLYAQLYQQMAAASREPILARPAMVEGAET